MDAAKSAGLSDPLIGAVDIGGTKIAVGLLTRDGEIMARRQIVTADCRSGSEGAAAITIALEACLSELGAQMCGIGIGSTGPVDPLKGTIGKVANLPGWEGYCLADALSDRFGTVTAMENDADAAALAEYRWGCGAGATRFLYVTLSTGIGTGFIVDGKLYRGTKGSHPELGHHVIDPRGPLCYCGASGCWESLASGLAVRDWFLQNAEDRITSPGFSARDVFALFDRGDALAQEAVTRLGFYVGVGLANLTTIFVPDTIALGGGLTARADTFLPAAEELLRRTCGEVPVHETTVQLAHLRTDVGLAGAGAAWLLRDAETMQDGH